MPANSSAGAYVDTTLQITFDSAPTLGTSGYISVYNAATNALVDKISLNVFSTGSWADDATAATPGLTSAILSTYNTTTIPVLAPANTEVDKIGNVSTLSQYRWVLYRPVTISGKTATIKLHDNKLSPSTGYYVLMDSSVLSGTYNGAPYGGISSPTVWAFTTKAAPASTTSVTVDDDGAADFRTVQGGLNWLMKNCGGTSTDACNNASIAKTLTIKNGTYKEMLFARGINNLTIQGESRDGAVVQYDMYNDFNPGTGGSQTLAATITNTSAKAQKAKDTLYRAYLGGGRPVLLVESADLLNLTQFTLQNTHVKGSVTNDQAETIYFNSGSGRLAATYMNFLSAQDTIQVKGYSWFYKSLIAGDVDFIWGAPYASLFEESEIRTIVDTSDASKGGYLVQSRAYYGYPGFVFLNSSLTAAAGVPAGVTYLARSGGNYCSVDGKATTALYTKGSSLYCDNVSFVNTRMGAHIASAGWFEYISGGVNKSTNLPVVAAGTAIGSQAALYVDLGSTGTTNTGTFGVSAANGFFEYGSKDASNVAISSHSTDGTYSQQMSSAIYASSYSSRAQILQSFGSNAGWAPTAAACSTAACATTK